MIPTISAIPPPTTPPICAAELKKELELLDAVALGVDEVVDTVPTTSSVEVEAGTDLVVDNCA